MKTILKERFGDNVKTKEFSPKKKFFGFANLLSGSLDMLIYKIDERSLFKRFGL
jgi:hypothetical protein